jgi:hypothetical protein
MLSFVFRPAGARALGERASGSQRSEAPAPPSGPKAPCSQRTTSTRPAVITRAQPLPLIAIEPGEQASGAADCEIERHASRGPAPPLPAFAKSSSPPFGHPSTSSLATKIPRLTARARTSRFARQSPEPRSRARPRSQGGRGSHPAASVEMKAFPQCASATCGATQAPASRRRSGRQAQRPCSSCAPGGQITSEIAEVGPVRRDGVQAARARRTSSTHPWFTREAGDHETSVQMRKACVSSILR